MRQFIDHLYKNNEIDNKNFTIAWIESNDDIKIKNLNIYGTTKKIKISIDKTKKQYKIHPSEDINYAIMIMTLIEAYTHYDEINYMYNTYIDIKNNINIKNTFNFKYDFEDFDYIIFLNIVE